MDTPNPFSGQSLAELGRALRSGATTSVDLTEAAVTRLDGVGRSLNAVVTLTRERALAEARRADDELAAGIDRGPIHGIPYGAKDLLAAEGYPTTWGAPPLRDQVFPEDAAVVARLSEAGAVLCGKLATVEIAGGMGYDQPDAALTGPGRNAWDPEAWAGGSSSGSGAAVAARLIPFAIGSETWGSIHCPAAFNGVTGLRPTYGRVPRDGAMALSWSLDKIGPLATSAEDARLVLAIIGDDGRLPLLPDHRTSGFRFGVLRSAVDGAEPSVAENARRAITALGEIGTVEEIALPHYPWSQITMVVLWAEEAAAFEAFVDSGQVLELAAPEDRIGMLHGMAMPAVDYLRAQRIRKRAAVEAGALLARFDVLVAPSYPVVAPPLVGSLDAYFEPYPAETLSAMGNLLGLPSISLPTGIGQRGLPTSIELLGRAWSEPAILAAARAFQARTDWHTRTPPAAGRPTG